MKRLFRGEACRLQHKKTQVIHVLRRVLLVFRRLCCSRTWAMNPAIERPLRNAAIACSTSDF
ncbi:MAG: hypothetical protein LBJ00_07880 [Planctomycetaceae bacterium]|nr:hypothetical protein [Planctomycetaceae bacterium]